jgi:PPOX class probable F420-dependent enzyme
MTETETKMTPAELRAFLDERHLAVLTTHGADGYPHATPVWYLAELDGALSVIVLADAVKVRNIRRDPRIAITIAPESRPYAYARYRGDAELLSQGVDDYPRIMAHRYMGKTAGDEYLASLGPEARFLVIRLRDDRVDTWKSANDE